MNTIKAIDTVYAGCRFRSRLEARWAVFFDHLGVTWQYEPQGFYVTDGTEPAVAYLPDFWLPDLELWVEVKGNMTVDGLHTLCLASYDDRGGLPLGPEGPMPDDSTRNRPRILILGDIPRCPTSYAPTHWRLDFHKGGVSPVRVAWASHLELRVVNNRYGPIYDDSNYGGWSYDTGNSDIHPAQLAEAINASGRGEITCPASVRDAYAAACTARFEHGETGRRP